MVFWGLRVPAAVESIRNLLSDVQVAGWRRVPAVFSEQTRRSLVQVNKGRDIRNFLICRHRRKHGVLFNGLDVADENHGYVMPAAQTDHLREIGS